MTAKQKIPALPLTTDNATLCTVYCLEEFEADPKPYKLLVQGPGLLDTELGILYREGELETYAGACLLGYLIGRPARVTFSPYRLRADVKPYRAPVMPPPSCRKWGAVVPKAHRANGCEAFDDFFTDDEIPF